MAEPPIRVAVKHGQSIGLKWRRKCQSLAPVAKMWRKETFLIVHSAIGAHMNRPQNPASSFATDSASQSRRGRRGKGATRAKLAMAFIEDLSALWEDQGESILARAAFADPVAVVNAMVRLMPQKIEIAHPTDGMSDEELAGALDNYRRIAALKAGAIEGVATVLPTDEPMRLAHEKRPNGDGLDDRGGGRGGVEPRLPEKAPHTLDAPAAETADEHTNLLDDVSPMPSTPPYPVFRRPPAAPPDSTVERRNKAGLEEDIDPASLF